MEKKIKEIQQAMQEESKRVVKLSVSEIGEKKKVFFVLKDTGDCYYECGKEGYPYYYHTLIDVQRDFVEKYVDHIKSFFRLEDSYTNYTTDTCAPITHIKLSLLGKEKTVSVYSFDYDSWVQVKKKKKFRFLFVFYFYSFFLFFFLFFFSFFIFFFI